MTALMDRRTLLAALPFAAAALAVEGPARSRPARAGPANWPAWAVALEREVAPLAALQTSDEARWARLPTIRAAALRIPADGRTDVTRDLQAALDSLSGGGTLVLDSGDYVQSDCLTLASPRVRLIGENARLSAVDPDRMCIRLAGDETELRGLFLTANTNRRGVGPEQARVVVNGRGTRVVGNRIVGATSAGIWVEGARDYAIVDNDVVATLADGIYQSNGACRGYVARNMTEMTEDDGISAVSYRSSEPCRQVLIENNRVSNVRGARGISVVGSSEIIVHGNRIDGTGRAAGIIVTREESYDTYGVDRVIVADNTISGVARRFAMPASEQTGQASIDINDHSAPSPDLRVRRVLVSGNSLNDGGTDGVRLLGAVCEVAILDNRIRNMAGSAIALVDVTCPDPLLTCRGNQIDGGAAAPAACGTS
ncbi:MAG: right-handed parallel beta-helix repeat-containing protein [Xanthobacteraceae bacterium]